MKYEGELRTPIVRPTVGIFEVMGDADAAAQRIATVIKEQQFAKLPALFAAHGVAEGNYAGLALSLAQAHVPGFKVIAPAGRPSVWTEVVCAEFKLDVDAMVMNFPQLSVTAAMKKVVRQPHWSERLAGASEQEQSLRKHYNAADAKYVKMVADARAYRELQKQ